MDEQNNKPKVYAKKLVSKKGVKYLKLFLFNYEKAVTTAKDGTKYIPLLVFNELVEPEDFLMPENKEGSNNLDNPAANSDDFEF